MGKNGRKMDLATPGKGEKWPTNGTMAIFDLWFATHRLSRKRWESQEWWRQFRHTQTQSVECWISGNHGNHTNEQKRREREVQTTAFPKRQVLTFRVAQEPNRNRKPEPAEPFSQEPNAEPEPPEPFPRTETGTGTVLSVKLCWNTEKPPP